MTAFDTHADRGDDDSQTLRSQRVWKAAGKQDLDFDSQRLRNRLRAKMFGVDASPVKIGRFVVLETVGSGGMGVVYAAYDEQLDRRVAVKLLRSSREDDASVGKGRLHREAQALAKLSHPNVVQVYEVGTFDDRVFLAMEFLSGPNLRAWLLDEQRPWEDVLHHFIEAGEGLAAAHGEGIIHRDFKPANVLFGGDERVRVVDFGLARASGPARVPQPTPSGELKEQALEVELTQTGEIMGTPAYMSPEQARYEKVDARSDQYSFCVALYEALFGRRPHGGQNTAEVLVSVAEGRVEPPPRNTKVPARIVRAIMRGLSAEPADRFPSMAALLAELSPPERGRWRFIGGGAIVVAGLWALVSTGSGAQCPSFDSSLSWGVDERARIEQAFVDSGAPQALSVATRVGDRLDAYAGQWVEARRDACGAHRIRHEQSDHLHDQRVACLLEREIELQTLVSVFAEADVDLVEHAPRAVAELSPVAECQDFERMSAAASNPVDPALRRQLAELRAHTNAGLYDRALASAEQLIEAASAQSAAGIEAASYFQRGLVQERRWAFTPAIEAMERALDLAEEAGNDELAARSWTRLARYHARLGDARPADEGMRHAWAKVRRLGNEPELVLEARESQALVAWQAGRHESAIDDQVEVVEQYLQQRGQHDPRTADAERRLANMLSDAGRHEEAQVRYQRARDTLIQAYGPRHPLVAHVVLDAAIDHRTAGDSEAMREGFLEAEALFVDALGPDAPALLTVHKVLAEIAMQAGEFDEAERRIERLLALIESTHAPATDRADALAIRGDIASHRRDERLAVDTYREYLELTGVEPLLSSYKVHRIATRINLADLLIESARIDEAELEANEVLSELELGVPESLDSAFVADLSANAWLLIGRCAEARGDSAVAALEEGLRVWPADASLDSSGQNTRARLRWALAQELASSEPARARSLAEAARPALDEPTRAQLDRWLPTLAGT